MTQQQLATRAGLAVRTVAKIEGAQQDVLASTLVALARAMNLDPRDLLPETEVIG